MKYFYQNDNNEQVGLIDIENLKLINIKSSTLIWKEGTENWSEAKNFEELKELFLKPPPLPINTSQINNNQNIDKYKEPNFWSPKGIIRRFNYFEFLIGLGLISLAITAAMENLLGEPIADLIALLLIPVLYLFIVIIIKRLHDMNLNGWFFFIGFIPLINLMLLFWDGTEGPNKYGPDPRGRKPKKK